VSNPYASLGRRLPAAALEQFRQSDIDTLYPLVAAIETERKARGWSLTQLCAHADVDRGTWRHVRLRKRPPAARQLARFFQVLNLVPTVRRDTL